MAELLSRVSSEELTEWQAYYAMEPFGQERGDLQAGVVASTVVNLFKEKGDEPSQPSDFKLEFKPKKPEVDPDGWKKHLAFAEMMVAFGYGKIISGKESADGSS